VDEHAKQIKQRSIEPRNISMTNDPVIQEKSSLNGVGGWLLLLCLSLVVFSPLYSVITAVVNLMGLLSGSFQGSDLRSMMIIDLIFVALLTVFSIHAGLSLWQRRPNAVNIARWFLACALAYSLFILIVFALSDIASYERRNLLYLIRNSGSTLVHVVLWLAYLSRSKRVKETYAESDASGAPAAYKTLAATRNYFALFGNESSGISYLLPLMFFCASMLTRVVGQLLFSIAYGAEYFPDAAIWALQTMDAALLAVLFLLFSRAFRQGPVFPIMWGVVTYLNSFAMNALRHLIESQPIQIVHLFQPMVFVDLFLYGFLFAGAVILAVQLFGVRTWALFIAISVSGIILTLFDHLAQNYGNLFETISQDMFTGALYGVSLYAAFYLSARKSVTGTVIS
jgi:hypothetical protein